MQTPLNSGGLDRWQTRYSVVLLAAAAVFICYMDRVVISVAIIPMADDFQWSPEQQGRVLSSFFCWLFVHPQVAGGWLAERFGGKVVLGSGVVFWSFFTLITPGRGGWRPNGLADDAHTYGCWRGGHVSIYLCALWALGAKRGAVPGDWSSVFDHSFWGVYLRCWLPQWIVSRYGWQMAFYAFGGHRFHLVVLLAPPFRIYNRKPHPRVTQIELQTIRDGEEQGLPEAQPPSLRQILSKTRGMGDYCQSLLCQLGQLRAAGMVADVH